jgi:hypothetical protein
MLSWEMFDAYERAGILSKAARAHAIAEMLRQSPVSTMAEIQNDALAIAQIRDHLVGAKDADGNEYSQEAIEEMDADILELTRANGLVHSSMQNGYLLCSTSRTRKLIAEDGTPYPHRETVRFVSDDEAITFEYRIGPAYQRLENMIERTSDLTQDGLTRLPALKKYLPRQLRHTHDVMQAELPLPKTNQGGQP